LLHLHFNVAHAAVVVCWTGARRGLQSYDAGKTVSLIVNATASAYFVMIDAKGWYFTATQSGAFVSSDRGATWNALHVIIQPVVGPLIDRVPHDYQRIVPDFRGDGIAFPSDQGLHILNRSSFQLISAVGDMKNAIALSALIAPNAQGSRNLIVNM
jgi:ligand-binding sensor domain-containing protein